MSEKKINLTDVEIGMKIFDIIIKIGNEQMYKAIANPSRLKIVDIIASNDKPLSLMELSRKSEFSKTNTMHHIDILEKARVLAIENSKKQQHNPLLITLEPEIKKLLVVEN